MDSGTSATPPQLLNDLHAAVPQAVRRVFYGSTEAGAVTLLRDEDMQRKPGSCGSPQHSVEISLAPGTGELLVRGPLIFSGYYNDKAATDAAMAPGGWFRAGDLADVDDEGFVSIVGRARDIIRTGGETVAPSEVEEVLSDHPAFVDVAVVGIPDAQWGEVVCATVVLRQGAAPPSLDELGRPLQRSSGQVQAAPAHRGLRCHPPHAGDQPGATPPVDRADHQPLSRVGGQVREAVATTAPCWLTMRISTAPVSDRSIRAAQVPSGASS